MTPSYTPLKPIPEDVEQCPCAEDHSRKRFDRLWRLSVVNAVLLLLQLAFFASHMAGSWFRGFTTTEASIQATYGFDTNYMSIDPTYDWVWEERAIERAGTIAVSRDEAGDVTEMGTISMYVLT
jgi:hypothetical protein